jgi:hypothetical protein
MIILDKIKKMGTPLLERKGILEEKNKNNQHIKIEREEIPVKYFDILHEKTSAFPINYQESNIPKIKMGNDYDYVISKEAKENINPLKNVMGLPSKDIKGAEEKEYPSFGEIPVKEEILDIDNGYNGNVGNKRKNNVIEHIRNNNKLQPTPEIETKEDYEFDPNGKKFNEKLGHFQNLEKGMGKNYSGVGFRDEFLNDFKQGLTADLRNKYANFDKNRSLIQFGRKKKLENRVIPLYDEEAGDEERNGFHMTPHDIRERKWFNENVENIPLPTRQPPDYVYPPVPTHRPIRRPVLQTKRVVPQTISKVLTKRNAQDLKQAYNRDRIIEPKNVRKIKKNDGIPPDLQIAINPQPVRRNRVKKIPVRRNPPPIPRRNPLPVIEIPPNLQIARPVRRNRVSDTFPVQPRLLPTRRNNFNLRQSRGKKMRHNDDPIFIEPEFQRPPRRISQLKRTKPITKEVIKEKSKNTKRGDELVRYISPETNVPFRELTNGERRQAPFRELTNGEMRQAPFRQLTNEEMGRQAPFRQLTNGEMRRPPFRELTNEEMGRPSTLKGRRRIQIDRMEIEEEEEKEAYEEAQRKKKEADRKKKERLERESKNNKNKKK